MPDIMDDLRDLHRQATTENSHFYTAKVISAAMVEIVRLRSALKDVMTEIRDLERGGMSWEEATTGKASD